MTTSPSATVGQHVGPQHGAGGDERGRAAGRAEPPPEREQRRRQRAADERHERRRRGRLQQRHVAGDRAQRLDERDGDRRQQRQQQPVLRVVLAVVAGDAELRRHRQRPVVDERAGDREHRAAVEHRHLRLPHEQQEQRDRDAEPHRELAVVPRRSHRGQCSARGAAAHRCS
jgi:hypothetical protein